jgi:hypothetical protein
MANIAPAIITIQLLPYTDDHPEWKAERIHKILVGNQMLHFSTAEIEFKANGTQNMLVLSIPLRYVNLTFLRQEDLESTPLLTGE